MRRHSILYAMTMKSLDYRPGPRSPHRRRSAAAGPSFGPPEDGERGVQSFVMGRRRTGSTTYLATFREKTGYDLDDTSARIMQGSMVLADAINRAGSTEPAKIKAELRATNLKPNAHHELRRAIVRKCR
jgi:branched-chain amino acid transport system substrate-binding protein